MYNNQNLGHNQHHINPQANPLGMHMTGGSGNIIQAPAHINHNEIPMPNMNAHIMSAPNIMPQTYGGPLHNMGPPTLGPMANPPVVSQMNMQNTQNANLLNNPRAVSMNNFFSTLNINDRPMESKKVMVRNIAEEIPDL